MPRYTDDLKAARQIDEAQAAQDNAAPEEDERDPATLARQRIEAGKEAKAENEDQQ